LAFDALGNVGPFDGHLNFVSAVSRFNPSDLAYRDHGAVPKAIGVGTGFSFDTFSHNSRIGFSYQHSWQASQVGLGAVLPGAGLPRQRVQGDYTINLFKYAKLQFLVHYDDDYHRGSGGTGKDSVTGLVRLALGIA
jgi:hypothetical protein